MSPARRKLTVPQPPGTPDLRAQVEVIGTRLAESFGSLIGSIGCQGKGPRALATTLGITPVTASRLLRSVGERNPFQVVQHIPGTVPLRRTVDAMEAMGAPADMAEATRTVVGQFEALIRENAGHRSSFNAMLLDWLPQGRREFEIRRRQSVYKALCELRGIHCEVDFAVIALHPSKVQGRLDLLSIQGMLGLDRLRPDASIHVGTQRHYSTCTPETAESLRGGAPQGPFTLDGEPAVNGLDSARLDEFCQAAPAPLDAKRFGDNVQYTLGPTGSGPSSKVDLVLAEFNPAELGDSIGSTGSRAPYYYHLPAVPTRVTLFDLIVHKDVYLGHSPELFIYDTAVRGPSVVGDPESEIDRQQVFEELEHLGFELPKRRFPGYPRYAELLDHAFGKLGWHAADFQVHRIEMDYPLHATQIAMGFPLDKNRTGRPAKGEGI